MEEFITYLFREFHLAILYIYALSIVLLVGSSFSVSFLVGPILFSIKIPHIKYEKILALLRRFLCFNFAILAAGMISGLIISLANNFELGNPATDVIANGIYGVWIFMGANLGFMCLKAREAKKHFSAKENIQANEILDLTLRYLLVFNLILGVSLIYLNLLLGSKQCLF